MNYEEKSNLARIDDSSDAAAGIRLEAAMNYINLNQSQFGECVGKGKAAINNMVKGRSFPSRDVMSYLFKNHRIDYNFMINGSFSQLPSDVQDGLFAELEALSSKVDPEAN